MAFVSPSIEECVITKGRNIKHQKHRNNTHRHSNSFPHYHEKSAMADSASGKLLTFVQFPSQLVLWVHI